MSRFAHPGYKRIPTASAISAGRRCRGRGAIARCRRLELPGVAAGIHQQHLAAFEPPSASARMQQLPDRTSA